MKKIILILCIPFVCIAQKKQKTKILRDSSGVTLITIGQTGGQNGLIINNVYTDDPFVRDAPMNPHGIDSSGFNRK